MQKIEKKIEPGYSDPETIALKDEAQRLYFIEKMRVVDIANKLERCKSRIYEYIYGINRTDKT